MRRSFARISAVLAVLTFVSGCLQQAQGQEAVLTVRPLRDGGGIERGLNIRLTTALARFLTDHAPKAVQIAVEGKPAPLQIASALRYSVEGDLNFADGADEPNARFLLIVRLYRDAMPRMLIGQWAGTADSLRSLTVNLRRDPRVHALGLVGETGSRIVACVSADSTTLLARWSCLSSRLTAQNSFLEMVSADEEARTLRQVELGDSFRLRSRRDVSFRAYLLLNDAVNGLHLAPLSQNGDAWNRHNREQAVSMPLTLPEGTRGAWVVWNLTNMLSLSTHCVSCTAHADRSKTGVRQTCIQEDDPPVQVLNGIGNKNVTSEPAHALKQLLEEISHAPQAWRVQKLRIADRK